MCKNCAILLSLPAWECGLKLIVCDEKQKLTMSLPAWECGLKFHLSVTPFIPFAVTPCVGVWIEIF